MEVGEIYLVSFPDKGGNEFRGKHYAVILTKPSQVDQTMLVAPITGKKAGENKKYKGGITINNLKYQQNPSYEKSFIYSRKIQEIDKRKIIYKKRKVVDNPENFTFHKIYKPIYKLDNDDFERLKRNISQLLEIKSQ